MWQDYIGKIQYMESL